MAATQRTTKEVVTDTQSHLRELVEAHVELAKAEMKQAQAELVKGLVPVLVAAVLGLYILGLLAVTAATALHGYGVVSEPVAWMIVTGAEILLAVVLLLSARARFQRFDPSPEQTQQSIRETMAWARTKTGKDA